MIGDEGCDILYVKSSYIFCRRSAITDWYKVIVFLLTGRLGMDWGTAIV